jgi:hypothetical protein
VEKIDKPGEAVLAMIVAHRRRFIRD